MSRIRRRSFLAATTAGVGMLSTPGLVWADDKPPADDPSGEKPWWLVRPMRLVQTNLREIDATLDIDLYLRNAADLSADVMLFNVGGIVANYPTELPFQYRNPNLKNDLVGEVLARLHAKGIRMIGRFDFSKLNEQLAAKRPEWLYKCVKGKTVNYNGQVHTCINGGYQQDYLFKILGEAIDRYPLDGVFFNMIGYVTRDYSGNYHGICQCDSCRKRFGDATGLELPTKEDSRDPVFRRFQRFRRETSDELFHRVNRFIRQKSDKIAVCTYTPAGVDIIRRESNSALGRPLPEWNYSASDNVKSAMGSYRDKVVANAAVHFVDYQARHAAVSPYLTELRLVGNLANGGWLDYYCIGPVQRQQDRQTLDKVRAIYRFHAENQTWFTGTRPVAEVCLIKGGNEYRGLFRILAENQVLFDVSTVGALSGGDAPKRLEDYAVVVLPDVRNLSDDACRKLDDYVAGGGKLLLTGRTSTCDPDGNPLGAIRLKSAGVNAIAKIHPDTDGTYFQIRPQDRPLLALDEEPGSTLDLVYLDGEFLECDPAAGTTGLLGYIPAAMFGPPEKCYYTEVTDLPGLLHHSFGKGQTAYFPWQIGSHYERRSQHGHAMLVTAALEELLDIPRSVCVSHADPPGPASPLVEITRHASGDGRFEWIALINHSGQLGTAFHRPLPMMNVALDIAARKRPASVRMLRAKRDLPVVASEQEGMNVRCVVPRLERFEVVLLEYA